jgi:hypothetical protein
MTRGSETANRLTFALKKSAPREVRNLAINEISSVFLRNAGDLKASAADLGIGRSTLNRWIAEYPILRKHLEISRRYEPK